MLRFYFFISFFCFLIQLNSQTLQDNFEGTGNITSWFGDDCGMDINFSNPFSQGINLSNKVLKYEDLGGTYANIRLDAATNFNIGTYNKFVLKIYVASSSLTGNSPNQISLKLQNGSLGEPWSTQSEIIKPIILNQWQEVAFDFKNDAYINLDRNSLPPYQRTDFNRIVIQVNGENNSNHVTAYLDDFYNESYSVQAPVFDNLVWSDEFDGSGTIDGTKWFQQTQLIAGTSWANGEEQHYTNRQINSFKDGGSLKIKAIRESFTDQGVTKNYTSARLNSKFAFKYGKLEVRAKLPSIAGTWPAIWLLGKNINENGGYWDNQGFGTTSWPSSGEIDVMEPNVAKTQILGTWHWNNGSGYQFNSKGVATNNVDTSQNFHNYILEWNATTMKIFIDTVLINEMPTVNPFNQEFYILLNVAMGGSLGGPISSQFNDETMEIDYVRVYQESNLSTTQKTNNAVRLYPNPVSNKLTIELGNVAYKTIKLQVIDINGRLIYDKQHAITDFTIGYDATNLKSGLYFIRLTQKNGAKNTLKFIKH